MMNYVKKNALPICIGIFLALLSFVYIRNIFHYNTYWAYDGGAHVEYIFTIVDEGRLPAPEENYLAWHEPLFYMTEAIKAHALMSLGFTREAVIYMLQFGSAIIGILFVVGSGALSYIVMKKKGLSFFVMIFTGFLYIVTATSRYITNELFFHMLTVWLLVLFFHWKMYERDLWNWKRWLSIILYLGVLVWIKLTAWVVVFALVLWLVLYSVLQKHWKGLLLAGLVFILVGAMYSPWLMYKHQVYGGAFTINSYETQKDMHMPLTFFVTWDNDILDYPFWDRGKDSFWSMFFASAFVDYDNVFENYESGEYERGKVLQSPNGRYLSIRSVANQSFLFWVSLPFTLLFLLGGVVWLVRTCKSRLSHKDMFLGILAFGFFASLVYNVWQYPFLERGTLKAIFILTFFPLIALLSIDSLQKITESWKYKTALYVLFWLYVIVWGVFSLNAIVLPA
ncbi:hypothetical protein C0581_02325 [Candidatus Parcubacteria bacterium]|nr:MAG: hypothetical protein C0581_02325 [Candidatus Parcubacteria bacterium]